MNSKIIAFPNNRPKFVPRIVGGNPALPTASAPLTRETVTFFHPFTLPGLDTPHRPGTFELRHLREPLDVTWDAWRVTTTILLTDGGSTEALDVKATDLAEALARDAAAV